MRLLKVLKFSAFLSAAFGKQVTLGENSLRKRFRSESKRCVDVLPRKLLSVALAEAMPLSVGAKSITPLSPVPAALSPSEQVLAVARQSCGPVC